MRRQFSLALMAAAIFAVIPASALWAQNAAGPMDAATAREKYPLSVSLSYNAVYADVITENTFWMQGGRAEICGDFYRGLGVVADISGMHQSNINSSGIALDLVTATFGARYTWSPKHARSSLYGQALAGVANGLNGLFPSSPTTANTVATSLAVNLGGGMEYNVTPRVAIRVVEANWLRTQVPNLTTNGQNDIQFGSGIVFRFR